MAEITFTAPGDIAGTPGSWDDAVAAADFNALANNGGVVGPEFDNSTTRYRYARLHFRMVTSTVSPSEGAHLAILVLSEGSTATEYDDSENTSTAANLPALTYSRGVIGFRAKASQSIKGTAWDIPVPPSKFKFYVINRTLNATSALPASSTNMTLQVQFYNEEVA
jgi:hypothetical protein